MHLDASATDTWQSCERYFCQKTLYRFQEIYPKGSFSQDAAYHRVATLVAKDFIDKNDRFDKRDSVENKPASLLVLSLGKALNGTPPFLCGRQRV